MRGNKPQDLVYGRWPVKEALEASTVSKVFISKSVDKKDLKEIMTVINKKRVQYVWVERRRLDQMVKGNHQGIAAAISPVEFTPLATILNEGLKKEKGVGVIFLDGVQDPQNLGALLRSAAFFGVAGVVIPKWRGVTVTGTVVKTSAGAARLIPIAQVSNLAQSLERAKEAGYWLAGADMEGENLKEVSLPRPIALIMGSEGQGLARLTKEKCDFLVSVAGDPGRQGIDSLNVAACCGMILHHLY